MILNFFSVINLHRVLSAVAKRFSHFKDFFPDDLLLLNGFYKARIRSAGWRCILFIIIICSNSWLAFYCYFFLNSVKIFFKKLL